MDSPAIVRCLSHNKLARQIKLTSFNVPCEVWGWWRSHGVCSGVFAECVCGETASNWRVCVCIVGLGMMNSSSRSNDDGVSVIGVEELNLSLV